MKKVFLIDFLAPYIFFYLITWLCFGFSTDSGVPVFIVGLSFFVALSYFVSLHAGNIAYTLIIIGFPFVFLLCLGALVMSEAGAGALGFILLPEAVAVFVVLILGRLVRAVRRKVN